LLFFEVGIAPVGIVAQPVIKISFYTFSSYGKVKIVKKALECYALKNVLDF
jgi:hypothetical protein